MNANRPRCEAPANETLALDGLLTNDERRTSSVEHHQAFRQSIARPCDRWDEIDHECDIDPLLLDRPPGHRSESDISRLDAIFAELERRKG